MDLDVCMNENNTNSPGISITLDKSSVSEENLCDLEIDCKDDASFNITMMDSEDKNNADDEVCINGNNSTKFNTSHEQSFVSESSNLCADKIDEDDSSSMILSVSTDKQICMNQENCITESNTTLSNVSFTQERSLVSESINLCNNKQSSKEKCENEEQNDTKTIELPINRNIDISSNKEDRPNATLPDNICSEKILEEIGEVINDVKSIEPPNLTQTSENVSENNSNTNLTNVDCITIIKSEHLSEDVFENFSVKLENFQVEEETIIDVIVANDSGELNNDLTNICNEEEVENKDDNDTIIESYSLNCELDEVKNDSDDAIFIEDCKLGSSDKNEKSFIKEGSAEILLQTKNVFYNPVQEFNRDLSIAALTVFAEEHQTDPRYKNRGVKRKK
uniref:Uncharacterized protein n=1 Tax=Clastoptera arizonana TaxID=38151 RepID=A0A1B6E8N8_9HEMI